MKLSLLLFFSFVFLSCGRVENSSSQDRAFYNPTTGGSDEFKAAIAAISAKCSECHASWLGLNETDFVAAGLVIAKDPTNSKLYYRNQLGPGPANNMPDGGRPALNSTELQALATWINTIN